MYTNDNGNGNNILMANRVEQIYDVILGAGCIVFSLLALSNLFIVTINKFVNYYSRQIDRIVMDESESESEYSDEDESEFSDDDDDSSESEYSEYSDEDESEFSDDDDDDSDCHHHHHDDIELTPYIPPRRSERLAENRARCNSPLLVVRLKFE
jgi:hypothetical protein